MDELDQVIASNLSRLIAERGLRHVDLAQRLKHLGFPWTGNRVTHVVTGRRVLSLLEIVAICQTLQIPLSELLEGDGKVATPAGGSIPLAAARDLLKNGKWRPKDPPQGLLTKVVYSTVVSEEEQRAVKRLGLADVDALHHLAQQALGTPSIAEERDRRASIPPGASKRSIQALRGHAMRQILDELQQHLDAQPRATEKTGSR